MGEAKRRKLLKKVVAEKHTDAITNLVEQLDFYQIYTKYHIQKKGYELMELVRSGKLDPGSFKDQRIVENNTYDMAVQEWQWVNHKTSIEKRVLFNESLPDDKQRSIDEVLNDYKKYVTDVLDKGCEEKPEKYRKMTASEFKAKVEELKIKAEELKKETENPEPEKDAIIASNLAEFYSDPEFISGPDPNEHNIKRFENENA